MLAISIKSCVCNTLVNDGCLLLDGFDGPEPSSEDRYSREPLLARTSPDDIRTDEGTARDGTAVGRDVAVEVEPTRESENPYPGSGRLNTLTSP